MDAYLGPLGSLIGFKCPSALAVAPSERSTFRRVLDGAVFEQRGPRGRRSWSVEIGTATPEQVRLLGALVGGFYGPPPWVFVDPWSRITNMFSPSQALLADGTFSPGTTLGGAGFTADGIRYGRSRNVASGNTSLHYRNGTLDRLPVLPGVPVTASVYASGTGSVLIEFFTETGTFISNASGATSAGTMTRRHVTATPPADARQAQVIIVTPSSLTLPAFTWTDSLQPWAPGSGCNRATVDGLAEAVQMAVVGSQRSGISFTVQELG